MTSDDFKNWRTLMGLNRVEAARALGLSRNQPQRYEDGEAVIPLYVALACSALMRHLRPWPE